MCEFGNPYPYLRYELRHKRIIKFGGFWQKQLFKQFKQFV